jgi:chemotaxis protein methyltransferase WspC
MGLAAFEDLLKASMGLSAASIGPAAIERAVRERLAACGLDDLPTYLERLRGSTSELQALIEAVVVPETWFFRDRHAFIALARLAQDWMAAHPEGVLSLLSLPCSTGEEPYSMAMTLLDASVPAHRFRVDAVDISARHLARGVQGVYGRNSFRGQDLLFRDQYFDGALGASRVKEVVRQQVHFQQGNLFAADFLPGVAIYDAIFCRNVLIYFDRPTQDRVLVVLNRLLAATGMLFVAPAETGLPGGHAMTSTNEPLAFAFRKVSLLAGVAKRKPAQQIKQAAPPRPVAPAAAPRRAAPLPLPPSAPAAPVADLTEARRLANQGHFVEAAARCEAHLRLCGPSAPAFYLLGLVRDATGSLAEAAAYYRKALYLDPNHYDTQIHLALLMEKQGDSAGATVVRNRTRRLEQTGRAPRE